MTKEEIIFHLEKGARVTHHYMDDKEWVKKDGNQLVMEDGAHIAYWLFWKDRENNEVWNDGWSVICDTSDEKVCYQIACRQYQALKNGKSYLGSPRKFEEEKKSKPLMFDIERDTNVPSQYWFGSLNQRKGRTQRYYNQAPAIKLIDHINLIKSLDYLNKVKNFRDMDTKQTTSTPTIVIMPAANARMITQANHPTTIKKSIADKIEKAIVNAAGRGENKTDFKLNETSYREFVCELLAANGYSFSHCPGKLTEFTISWADLLIRKTSEK